LDCKQGCQIFLGPKCQNREKCHRRMSPPNVATKCRLLECWTLNVLGSVLVSVLASFLAPVSASVANCRVETCVYVPLNGVITPS
jgi:hypothetical protein